MRFPQAWPHAALQNELANNNLAFKDLDIRLFIAGKLEIITADDTPSVERKGRLQLLKQLAYLQGTYSWDILKNPQNRAWTHTLEGFIHARDSMNDQQATAISH